MSAAADYGMMNWVWGMGITDLALFRGSEASFSCPIPHSWKELSHLSRPLQPLGRVPHAFIEGKTVSTDLRVKGCWAGLAGVTALEGPLAHRIYSLNSSSEMLTQSAKILV